MECAKNCGMKIDHPKSIEWVVEPDANPYEEVEALFKYFITKWKDLQLILVILPTRNTKMVYGNKTYCLF